jgi:hypothetical protein
VPFESSLRSGSFVLATASTCTLAHMTPKPNRSKRKDPTAVQRQETLQEAGYKCGNPACRNILALDLHHILWVKDDGPTDVANLIALCAYCHALHTRGEIPTKTIKHWKGLLVALNGAFNKEAMDLLLFLATDDSTKLWYSGDGVLRFAGLIASGLVELKKVAHGGNAGRATFVRAGDSPPPTTPPGSGVRLGLTDKGKLLVDSWIRGDEGTYVKALASRPADQAKHPELTANLSRPRHHVAATRPTPQHDVND